MKLSNFRLLSNNDQISLLHEEGVFVGKRRDKGMSVILYQLEGFYIEIFYKEYRRYIHHLYCFESTNELRPYLKQINVDELIKCAS